LKGLEEKETNVPQTEKDLEVLKGTQEADPNATVEKADTKGEENQEKAMRISDPSKRPLAEVRIDAEIKNMVGASLLVTSAVGVDNTIVSFGDYSFDRKSKSVVRRKTKKSGEAVVWTPQGENPKQRVMQSASALGEFTAMNLGAVYDVRREMESLRTQVANIQIDLQKAKDECVTITNKAEQKQTEQDAVIAANEELKKQWRAYNPTWQLQGIHSWTQRCSRKKHHQSMRKG